MSSLWTPEGEHPVGPDGGGRAQGPGRGAGRGGPPPTEPPPAPGDETAAEGDLDQLRRQLAETPGEVVVANHAFGLFELAAPHRSLQPPQREEARLGTRAGPALSHRL